MVTQTVSEGTSTPKTTSPRGTETEQRAGLIFSEVAELAQCIERMGILLVVGPEDERDAEAYLRTINALSAQIGLLCDFGARITGGLETRSAKVDQWLLSPAYRWVGERAEVPHG